MHNPVDMPEVTRIQSIEEPWIKATIMTPDEYLGQVYHYVLNGGEQIDLTYAGSRAMAVYRLLLNEVVRPCDRPKSVTRATLALIIRWTVIFQVIWLKSRFW